MYIAHGVNSNHELVYIDQVGRGKTSLTCPYCGASLTAKKGEVNAHHFAHTGATCQQVGRDQTAISLPVYDNFNLHLSGKAVKELNAFNLKQYGDYNKQHLEALGVIKYNDYIGFIGDYELTKTGKLVLGQLSLMLFCEFQEPLILARHEALESEARLYWEKPRIEAELAQVQEKLSNMRGDGGDKHLWKQPIAWREAYNALIERRDELGNHPARWKIDDGTRLQTALTDLRLYRAQWQRILSCSLYFLSINEGQLYKIGVTTRPIEQRVKEIRLDLAPHLGPGCKIEVLGTWSGRGNVELYFKHRYRANNTPLSSMERGGSLTEYYKFGDVKAVLRDLRRMKAKVFSELEWEVLLSQMSPLERHILGEQIEAKRRKGIRRGMRKAAERGVNIGRPKGEEESVAFLRKAKSMLILACLERGVSVRNTATECATSTTTVQKVKRLAKFLHRA